MFRKHAKPGDRAAVQLLKHTLEPVAWALAIKSTLLVQRKGQGGSFSKRSRSQLKAVIMGKVPVRLKEVVYMVSPFEVSILNGLFKDFGKKCQKNISEV